MDLNEIFQKIDKYRANSGEAEQIRAFSILIPLIEKSDGIHLLFEVRSLQLRRQPGEICFPGGRLEPSDASPLACAIRETSEELGISEQAISHVKPLDEIKQPLGRRIIYPFVGTIAPGVTLNPNPDEVKEIFTVPLNYFLQNKPERFTIHFKVEPEDNFPFHLIPGGKNYKWHTRSMEEYFYRYGEYTIWGLTANIVRRFIEIIQ